MINLHKLLIIKKLLIAYLMFQPRCNITIILLQQAIYLLLSRMLFINTKIVSSGPIFNYSRANIGLAIDSDETMWYREHLYLCRFLVV